MLPVLRLQRVHIIITVAEFALQYCLQQAIQKWTKSHSLIITSILMLLIVFMSVIFSVTYCKDSPIAVFI